MQKILSILILFFIPVFLYSQDKPDPPILKNVSVIPGTGNVRLDWELTDSGDLIIRRDSIENVEAYFPFDTIKDININSYIDSSANADINPRSYQIYTDSSSFQSNLSKKFNTFKLNIEYDSCQAKITLDWSNKLNTNLSLFDNEATFSGFEVYRSIDGNTYTNIGTTTATDQEFIDSNLVNRALHSYYIAAIQTYYPSLKSFSSAVAAQTSIPVSPNYINANKASVAENGIELEFHIDPQTELSNYTLYKASELNGQFEVLNSFSTTTNTITYTEETNTDNISKTYYYLTSKNNCGVETTTSDTINNLLLEINQNNYDIHLNWNKLKESNQKKYTYHVYRIIGDGNPQLIKSLFDLCKHHDNVEVILEHNASGKFQYYVETRINDNNQTYTSRSNIETIFFNPKVTVPNAFTPNNDGTNDEIKPVLSFVPLSYEFTIYNRWGVQLFYTNNADEAWDGKDSRNNPVSSGIYLYFLKLTTPGETILKKTGNITVIYP